MQSPLFHLNVWAPVNLLEFTATDPQSMEKSQQKEVVTTRKEKGFLKCWKCSGFFFFHPRDFDTLICSVCEFIHTLTLCGTSCKYILVKKKPPTVGNVNKIPFQSKGWTLPRALRPNFWAPRPLALFSSVTGGHTTSREPPQDAEDQRWAHTRREVERGP